LDVQLLFDLKILLTLLIFTYLLIIHRLAATPPNHYPHAFGISTPSALPVAIYFSVDFNGLMVFLVD